MLCLTLPTFSLSYCKFLKGNPVEYLTRDFEAFNKTLHIAGITGDFEAFSNNLQMASITCGFEPFSKKSHIRQVLFPTLNYQEGESPTTTLSLSCPPPPPPQKKKTNIFSYIYFLLELSGI